MGTAHPARKISATWVLCPAKISVKYEGKNALEIHTKTKKSIKVSYQTNKNVQPLQLLLIPRVYDCKTEVIPVVLIFLMNTCINTSLILLCVCLLMLIGQSELVKNGLSPLWLARKLAANGFKSEQRQPRQVK